MDRADSGDQEQEECHRDRLAPALLAAEGLVGRLACGRGSPGGLPLRFPLALSCALPRLALALLRLALALALRLARILADRLLVGLDVVHVEVVVADADVLGLRRRSFLRRGGFALLALALLGLAFCVLFFLFPDALLLFLLALFLLLARLLVFLLLALGFFLRLLVGLIAIAEGVEVGHQGIEVAACRRLFPGLGLLLLRLLLLPPARRALG